MFIIMVSILNGRCDFPWSKVTVVRDTIVKCDIHARN